jgi:primosomal protein N' (replication factor Y) (superfamily II helicase)
MAGSRGGRGGRPENRVGAYPPSRSHHVEVALPLPLRHPFTYRIAGEPPPPGTRVLVPFRRSEKVGWVTGPGSAEGLGTVRDVVDVLETEPSVPAELLGLARWLATYYVTPLGLTLRSMLPPVLSDGSREMVRLTDPGRALAHVAGGNRGRGAGEEKAPPALGAPGAGPELSAGAVRLLRHLAERSGGVKVGPLRRRFGAGSIRPAIRQLEDAGLLEHWTEPPPPPPVRTRKIVRILEWLPDLSARERIFGRAARQRECFELLAATGGSRLLSALLDGDGFSRSVVGGLEGKGLVEVVEQEVLRDPFGGDARQAPEAGDGTHSPAARARHRPNSAQAAALSALLGALDEPRPLPFLLHGVTGSGKTLVYLELLREVVEVRGRTAIVLVPEISLTPQTVSRFRARFGDAVAVLHSALSAGERYDQWRQLRAGEKRIVVGARSALFAPLPDLGAIVVDEEHDGSYKQSEAPRYHARDVAVVRARESGALCVLGTATPSLESWRNASRGKFRVLRLPERVGGRAMPPVELVDLRKRGRGGDGSDVLTPPLVSAVRERLERGEQSILLLNRRGYSSFIQCRACGGVQECPACSVSLTFHRRRRRLLCHHCRYEEPVPERCPSCGDPGLSYRGLGTEQVERVVGETFPSARIARMDVDTTGGKWSHAEILSRVAAGEVDILLGTQMIAKGLDFPRVTLVGVVNADVGLHLPDFRASERTFQLLSQVAGRAGRGPLGGRVLIQTSAPGHYAVRSALEHDFEGFAERELSERRSPPYPPLVRLVNVVVSSPDPELAADGAERAAAWVRERTARTGGGPDLVGPAPSPIERLHGRWRWHFFLRGGGVDAMTGLLGDLLDSRPLPSGDVRLVVDRDPVALL